jgi:hypothetical protein
MGFVGFGFVDTGFDGVVGALLAPEHPTGMGGVFDEAAGVGGFRPKFSAEVVEQRVVVFLAFVADEEFAGSEAEGEGVLARTSFAFYCGGSGLRMKI